MYLDFEFCNQGLSKKINLFSQHPNHGAGSKDNNFNTGSSSVKEFATSSFYMAELFCFSREIEMFSAQNLLDFVGFMQMTCRSGGWCGD